MAAGLGILRLPPQAFWAMTPRELVAAIRGAAGLSPSADALPRDALRALMQRFPDHAAASITTGALQPRESPPHA
jgi:uncharacterized phage protein (TIGR02216 family)